MLPDVRGACGRTVIGMFQVQGDTRVGLVRRSFRTSGMDRDPGLSTSRSPSQRRLPSVSQGQIETYQPKTVRTCEERGRPSHSLYIKTFHFSLGFSSGDRTQGDQTVYSVLRRLQMAQFLRTQDPSLHTTGTVRS